jgi:hypothetical protein
MLSVGKRGYGVEGDVYWVPGGLPLSRDGRSWAALWSLRKWRLRAAAAGSTGPAQLT